MTPEEARESRDDAIATAIRAGREPPFDAPPVRERREPLHPREAVPAPIGARQGMRLGPPPTLRDLEVD